MFQAFLTVESDDEAESTPSDPAPPPHYAQANILVDETEDDEEREYYTEVVDGVRSLRYSVVVPPDGPPAPLDLAPTDNSGNANEQHVNPIQPDSRWGENAKTTGMKTSTNSDATQSSSADPYLWGEGAFEPTWGTWRTRPAPVPYDPSWGDATQRWKREERENPSPC